MWLRCLPAHGTARTRHSNVVLLIPLHVSVSERSEAFADANRTALMCRQRHSKVFWPAKSFRCNRGLHRVLTILPDRCSREHDGRPLAVILSACFRRQVCTPNAGRGDRSIPAHLCRPIANRAVRAFSGRSFRTCISPRLRGLCLTCFDDCPARLARLGMFKGQVDVVSGS